LAPGHLRDEFTAYVPEPAATWKWQIRRRALALPTSSWCARQSPNPSNDPAEERVTGVLLDADDTNAIEADLVV